MTNDSGGALAPIQGREVIASQQGQLDWNPADGPLPITASGKVMTPTLLGCALPSVRALRRWVWITYQGRSVKVQVLDVGPWFERDDDYVFGGSQPAAVLKVVPTGERNPRTQRVARNNAGIDLFDETCRALGVAPERWGLRTVTWGWAD